MCSVACAPIADYATRIPPTAATVYERIPRIEKLAAIIPASRLEVRPAPEMASSGVVEIDSLIRGLPRGCLTEIFGPASSGRASILLAAVAAATQRQEFCALVDTMNTFDPLSGASAGLQFGKFLWVRCGTTEHPDQKQREAKKKSEDPVSQALRVTDLLLQSGGFGLVAIDLGDVPFALARRVPLASWFRFQRAVEHTPTVLLVITQAPCAKSCAALLLRLQASVARRDSSGKLSAGNSQCPSHAQLFDGLQVEGEILRARIERKPPQSVKAEFMTRAMRTG